MTSAMAVVSDSTWEPFVAGREEAYPGTDFSYYAVRPVGGILNWDLN